MTFTIVAGIKPNTPPKANTKLTDQVAYKKQLFYYKLPTDAFVDSDGDTLYYMISKPDGDYAPNWMNYEDITKTLSGIANENSTDVEILVIADDRRGGSASQTFKISID